MEVRGGQQKNSDQIWRSFHQFQKAENLPGEEKLQLLLLLHAPNCDPTKLEQERVSSEKDEFDLKRALREAQSGLAKRDEVEVREVLIELFIGSTQSILICLFLADRFCCNSKFVSEILVLSSS